MECCKGTVWVPFRMLRERIPLLSAMTLDQLGARMKCDRCGKRPERYYPANQSDTPGFVLERNLQGGFYASDNAGGCTFSAGCLCTD